jgi:hypothetical protein
MRVTENGDTRDHQPYFHDRHKQPFQPAQTTFAQVPNAPAHRFDNGNKVVLYTTAGKGHHCRTKGNTQWGFLSAARASSAQVKTGG